MLTSHGKHRYEELDSLRGVASVLVVLHHAYLFWQPAHPGWKASFDRLPLMPLSAGTEAVLIFFVLSGFVLCLPYLRDKRQDTYASFLIKRVCRLYLPYLAALLLAAAADLLFANTALAGEFPWWVSWHRPFPHGEFLWQLGFVFHQHPDEFNPNFWTLVQEMRISLFFPLIAWLALRLRLWTGVLTGLAMTAFFFWLVPRAAFTQAETLAYAGVFVVGASLAVHLRQVQAAVARGGATAQWLLLAAALFCFKAAALLPHRLFVAATMEPLRAAGAAVLVVLAVAAPRFRSLLHASSLRWLGKVSFSLYLVHAPVLYTLASLFWFRTSHHFALIIAGILLSVALAEPFYRWVEKPSIVLGRELVRRWRPAANQHAGGVAAASGSTP